VGPETTQNQLACFIIILALLFPQPVWGKVQRILPEGGFADNGNVPGTGTSIRHEFEVRESCFGLAEDVKTNAFVTSVTIRP
jgi:hypothetical protein